MTDVLTQAYTADIVKFERTEDGDLVVYGKAAGPELDIANQRCSSDWLKQAMPAWMEYGNIRQQHQLVAAGVGQELTEDGDSWMLKALIVDEDTKTKVEKRILKGFSVGIKNGRIMKTAEAPAGLIVGGDIIEISVVDRPANPTCGMSLFKSASMAADLQPVEVEDAEWDAEHFEQLNKAGEADESVQATRCAQIRSLVAEMIQEEAAEYDEGICSDGPIRCLLDVMQALCWFESVDGYADGDAEIDKTVEAATVLVAADSTVADITKRDFSAKKRKAAAKSGAAMGDGSFPIENGSDLKNAVRLAGNAKDPAKAKAHIKSRAKALGLSSEIPDTWKGATMTTKSETADESEVEEADTTKAPVTDPDEPATNLTADLTLSAVADLVKTACLPEASEDDKLVLSELRKAFGVDELKADLTKAVEANETLGERVAEMAAMAAPGGPSAMRSNAQTEQANEKDLLLNKAAEADRSASAMLAVDPEAARGYRQIASDLREQAAAK